MINKNQKKNLKEKNESKINCKELARMIKARLITDGDNDTTIGKIDKILELMTNSIASYIRNGKEIFLSGLGSFVIQKRKATRRRNPRNGQEIMIPEKEVVKVKLFKSFAEKLAPVAKTKSKETKGSANQ